MNSHPLVSIVTPCFNGERFIRQAIESVLEQDYPNIEYLVVDGGSTDGTLAALRSYGERVRWISEPDNGQSQALNKGFRMAKGEIVAWINADDVLLPGAVGKAVEAFVRDPELGMVYGEGFILEEDGAVRGRFPYSEPFDLWRLIWYWDPILQQSVFMRRAAVEAVGGVDESLHWGLDWDLFIRLAKRFPVERIEAEMGAIRDHRVSKTATGGLRRWRELAGISSRHAGRRITPASVIFGLDAYHKAVTARFGSGSEEGETERAGRASALARRGLLFVHGVAAHLLWPCLDDSQGWFEDGWAARTVHLAFPGWARDARLEIEGWTPDSRPAREQRLAVAVNGRTIHASSLPPGRFCLTAALPKGLDSAGLLAIDLRASQVVESRMSARGRPRRCCYRLDQVRLVTPQRTLACKPPQVFG